jgi:DNA-binding CsgD family transcriptional regulator
MQGAVPRLPEPLTEREREILKLLAAGKPNQQIAMELVGSLATVKKHVSRVLAKLGAANRTEATARARELGLLPSTTRGLPRGSSLSVSSLYQHAHSLLQVNTRQNPARVDGREDGGVQDDHTGARSCRADCRPGS